MECGLTKQKLAAFIYFVTHYIKATIAGHRDIQCTGKEAGMKGHAGSMVVNSTKMSVEEVGRSMHVFFPFYLTSRCLLLMGCGSMLLGVGN